jgi:hypothetical protein
MFPNIMEARILVETRRGSIGSTVADEAVAAARALGQTPLDALRLDTTGCTAAEAAGLIAAATG